MVDNFFNKPFHAILDIGHCLDLDISEVATTFVVMWLGIIPADKFNYIGSFFFNFW
jgi:hypothetical protein